MSPDEFRFLRRCHGSQRAVAKMLGVGYRSIQRLEDGSYGDPLPAKWVFMIRGLGSNLNAAN